MSRYKIVLEFPHYQNRIAEGSVRMDVRGAGERMVVWESQVGIAYPEEREFWINVKETYEPVDVRPKATYQTVKTGPIIPQYPRGTTLTVRTENKRFRYWPAQYSAQSVPLAYKQKAGTKLLELAETPLPQLPGPPRRFNYAPRLETVNGKEGHWHIIRFQPFHERYAGGNHLVQGVNRIAVEQVLVMMPLDREVFLEYTPEYRGPFEVDTTHVEATVVLNSDAEHPEQRNVVKEIIPLVRRFKWWPLPVPGQHVPPHLEEFASTKNTIRATQRSPHIHPPTMEGRLERTRSLTDPQYSFPGLKAQPGFHYTRGRERKKTRPYLPRYHDAVQEEDIEPDTGELYENPMQTFTAPSYRHLPSQIPAEFINEPRSRTRRGFGRLRGRSRSMSGNEPELRDPRDRSGTL